VNSARSILQLASFSPALYARKGHGTIHRAGFGRFIQKPYRFDSLVRTSGGDRSTGVVSVARQPDEVASLAVRSPHLVAPTSATDKPTAAFGTAAHIRTGGRRRKASREAMQFFFREADFSTLTVQDGEEANRSLS